ncbi:retrovirus-related pol polyprotein from transposon TNT 1-94 [Tanacetum coccineum]
MHKHHMAEVQGSSTKSCNRNDMLNDESTVLTKHEQDQMVIPTECLLKKDKDMQKNLALIAKYFKKLYKPTNNNLETSSNTINKNVDTTPRYKNDNQTGQFRNQSALIGKDLVIIAKECRKPKRVKDSTYHKEKMLLCKQAKKGVQLQAEQSTASIHVETGDSNVIPDSPDMCNNDIQNDQHDVECDDERVALANLIANLKLDVDDNKKIQKQLKKANATLTQELTECKSILAETSRTLGESNSIRDSCLVALQNKQTEFERYKAFNDRTVDYDKLERKLNETLGLLAQKDIDIQEGLKVKAYEISVVQAKHDELVKQSLLTRSHYEGLVKEKTKVITDLKLREDKDIDKMISMEHQIKFLNEIVYKRGQSIQTIQMLAPKCSTFNGRPTFANPMYHKKAQYEHPDVMCSFLQSSSDLDEITELQCLYLHKVKECDCLAQKLSEQTEFVSKKIYTELLQSFAKLEKHSISLEIALQECQEQLKNDTVCKEKASNVFRKEREHIFEIQNQKLNCKTRSNAINSLERNNFVKKKSVSKTNESEGLSKPVTSQNLPQTASQAVRNTNVIKPGMYRIESSTTQTRAPQLTQTSRNTNPRVSTSTRVAHKNNVSRPQPRRNQMKDKVVPNTSHVKFKKTEVEDHPRISSISNQTKSVTACNDSLNSRTSNVNGCLCTYGKCVFNSNHDACVSKYLNDVNARTKKPNVVPISTRKPKRQANKSVATPHKKTVASESLPQVSKSLSIGMLYQKTNCTNSSYSLLTGMHQAYDGKCIHDVAILLTNSLGTVRFGNVNLLQSWYGDLIQGNITIKRVYYVEGLNHNLFSVGQFCDADLEKQLHQLQSVLWLKHPLNLKHGYGERRLSHSTSTNKLAFKERYCDGLPKTEDETPEVLKEFLTMIQRNLQAPVISVRTDRGTEFLNKTLNAFFKEEGIEHQTSTPRTPEQNGVVERRNRTLVEAARTMLSASKLPLFFWAEAIATACYTQNRSIIIPTHEKTAYHIINDRKPSIKHLHIFGCTCYLTRDGENLDKMKEKGDSCILMSETSVANVTSGLVPQRQKVSDYDNPDPAPELQNVSPSADTTVPSQQELDLLFGPLYDEFFNDDTQPSTNIHPTSEPSTPTNAHAEENNVDQAIIPIFLYTDHPLSQVRGNPSKPVQTRRQLATYPEMCMFALTVSTAEPKNIKEGTWTENGISKWSLKEEVMLPQPDGVVDPVHLTKFTVKKDLYGLKQAPGACMMTLKILDFQGFNKVLGLQIHLNPHEVFLSIWPITFSDSEKTCKCTSADFSPGAFSLSAGCLRCMTVLLYHPQWLNYVALSGSCAQVMWLRTQLQDYGFFYNK